MSEGHAIVFEPVSDSQSKIPANGLAVRFLQWSARCPVTAVVFIALLAVVLNCYPIIFCGRSYVAPTTVNGALAHGWWWTVSSKTDSDPAAEIFQHNSDTGAMMWGGVPFGFIESRSLLEHGELPLWNRYSHAGDTLIGQAVSMFGDPLQLIVIFGHGSAWAWDIKFLVAKFVFCVGFGLLILQILRSQTLSLLYAALAAYCGAFFYISNHPVFFVFAYAPWILLAAIKWLDLRPRRQAGWGLAWLTANCACFYAGHVEVAVDLIGGLNLAALAYTLSGCDHIVKAAKVLGRLGIGTLCFLGLTAPLWLSFLGSLAGAYTAHGEVKIDQLPLTLLPGTFDELFFRLHPPKELIGALAPGTSLLILVGCIISIWRWRQLKGESFFWVNAGAISLWGACIFGCVPAFILAQIPLLNRVGHLNVDLSYLLIIHLTIQSAYGFKCLASVEKLRQMTGDLACIGGVFAGLILLYCGSPAHQQIPWDYFFCAAAGAVGAPLLFVYLKSSGRQAALFGWAGIIVLGFLPSSRFGLYHRGNDSMLTVPGRRTSLDAPSQAIDKLKADQSEPYRIVGLDSAFAGDYAAVYGLENIFSCAPLSNQKFIDLIRYFPGMSLNADWVISVKTPDEAQPLLNLLNVKYLLASPAANRFRKLQFQITDRGDFTVFENSQVWPRAFFANEVVSIDSTKKFVRHLQKNGRQPFVAVTPTELAAQPGLRQLQTNGPVAISPATHFRLSPNTTEFDIHASSAGVVCLTEGQAKDFSALANNEPKTVFTVNRAFKGIYLDQPGDYHVQFTYRPWHWRLAVTLFWAATTAAIVLTITSLILADGAQKAQTTPPIEKP